MQRFSTVGVFHISLETSLGLIIYCTQFEQVLTDESEPKGGDEMPSEIFEVSLPQIVP